MRGILDSDASAVIIMKFKIVCVGKLKEKYLEDAVNEYLKRTSRFCKTEIVEVAESFFSGSPGKKEREEIIERESRAALDKCDGYVIALDIDGVQMGSEEFAEKIDGLKQRYSVFTFVIGGSYGLSEALKKRSDLRLSFGKMTLPHQLCRVVLCEQLYRACAIQNNVPYHK